MSGINGIESRDFGVNSRIAGLHAQVAMIYVENLKIIDSECHGLLEKDYAIQINAENVVFKDDTIKTSPKHPVKICFEK